MQRVLITAFEPYDVWPENASWLAVVELTKQLPSPPSVTTRLYPVDYAGMRDRLERDLAAAYDFALHLGQAPGASSIQLEAIGINVAGTGNGSDECRAVVEDGPVAYRSSLPLEPWARRLREAGIPASVSHHAGTYLCNATLYMSHYLTERHGLHTRSAFVHLPLDPSQVAKQGKPLPSLPKETAARAIRQMLEELSGLKA